MSRKICNNRFWGGELRIYQVIYILKTNTSRSINMQFSSGFSGWQPGIRTALVLWYINHCRLFNARSSLYIYIKYIGFGWVLWYINHCRLFNAKSSLYIDIKYIWFSLLVFLWHINYYLMPNPLYTFILNIYDLAGLGLWDINHCRLFNIKSSLYIFIKHIWFGLIRFGFYYISNLVGYLMPNPF